MAVIGSVIVRIVVALPEIVAVGVGLVLSLVFRQRLGNRSLFTLLGFIAMLLAEILSLITAITSVYASALAESRHLSVAQVGAYFGSAGLLATVVGLAGWVLLLIGIFRKPGTAPGAPPVPGFAVPPAFAAQQPPAQQPPAAGPPLG